MFSITHNLYSLFAKKIEKNFTAACFGLNNAGKTTLVNTLKGDVSDPEGGNPTFGRAPHNVTHEGSTIKFVDIGGGKNMRGYWKDVYAEIHGAVYVIDSACPDRFEESAKFLHEMLEDELLAGKPILILLNKRDLPEAVAEGEIADKMRLHELKAAKWQMQGCVAIKVREEDAVHEGVTTGMRWLCDAVTKDYDRLDDRVERDVLAQQQREAAEKARKKAEREARQRKREEDAAREAADEAMKANEADQVAVPMKVSPTETARPPTEQTAEVHVGTAAETHATAPPATSSAVAPATPIKEESPMAVEMRTPGQVDGTVEAATPGTGGSLPPMKAPARLDPVKPPARLEPVQTPEKQRPASELLQDSPVKDAQSISSHPNVPPSPKPSV